MISSTAPAARASLSSGRGMLLAIRWSDVTSLLLPDAAGPLRLDDCRAGVIAGGAVLPTGAQFTALAALVRNGGVVVSTTVWMPAPADEQRGVRAVDLVVRSDATQLSELVARVDRGELTVDTAERVPLTELASVHARAAAGTLAGKIVVLRASA